MGVNRRGITARSDLPPFHRYNRLALVGLLIPALASCATPARHPATSTTAISAAIDSPPASHRVHSAPADATPSTDSAPTAENAASQLDRLFAEETRSEQDLDPVDALARGEPVAHDLLVQVFTPELSTRQRALNTRALQQLEGIDRAALDPQRRLSYDVFRHMLLDQKDMLDPSTQSLIAAQPFSQFNGFHVEFPEMAATDEGGTLRTLADFEARIALERTLPVLFDNAIARFREGMANGAVEPRLIVSDMIAQIDTILARPPADSLFTSPARNLPRSFSLATRARLEREFLAATTQSVYPAYRRLRAFLANEYLPVARTDVGLSAIPGGARLYRLLLREHTTLALDPDEVHRIGLSEVARIRAQMESVEHELGYTVPLNDFFEVIRSDRRFHPRTAQDLARGYREVGDAVALLAPHYFRHLPRTPLLIMPYPTFRARYEAGGGYSQGMPDGSRPGIFFYNTYDLPHRFLTGITTLYLHEGAPGHHFQISLAQENTGLPDFQRFGGNAAYVEGWALYAETLGYEMGFYTDPMQHWGTLDDEMLRAMRLVVDTGLHTRGWTREQAIDYMLANSGTGRIDATTEVDRYIANPGQAVAYKIGAMTIQRLRHQAVRELGPRFDIRDFHDEVLMSGALPLDVLDAKIQRWIADQESTSGTSAPAVKPAPRAPDLHAPDLHASAQPG